MSLIDMKAHSNDDRGGHSPKPKTADVKQIVSQLPNGPAPAAPVRTGATLVANLEVTNDERQDALYLKLLGARERLCVAQMLCKDHWRGDLQLALDIIDAVGSTLPQWSRFDQPEYPAPKT